QGTGAGLDQITVNCSVPLALVHGLLPAMVDRGRGGIVLVASGSALRGSPLVAGYAATKAWNLVLAESLWDEVRDAGVDVMAVLPGTTRTPGLLSTNPRASMATTNLMEPEEVVRETLDRLGTGPSLVACDPRRQREPHVDTRRDAGGRHDLSLPDDPARGRCGAEAPQRLELLPVGRRLQPVQQPGGAEQQRARADRGRPLRGPVDAP